jgi:hypothetical protein
VHVAAGEGTEGVKNGGSKEQGGFGTEGVRDGGSKGGKQKVILWGEGGNGGRAEGR